MKQITIVSHSRPGLTADICEVLADRGVNIETLDAVEMAEVDVVTLTVDKYDEALQALHDAGINAVVEDVVLLKVKDRPGALAEVTRRFRDADVYLRSIRMLGRKRGSALLAISMDRSDEAMELIKDLLVKE